MKFKCLIIDDEPIARQIVEKYCSYLPEIEVVASCRNALEAKQIIQTQAIDLIFLDINMPVLDGIAFVKTLRNPPQVIFTTAYKEFAHEAFDLTACDYLLKPFSLERFIVAVDKAKEKLIPGNQKTQEQLPESFTYIRCEGKIYKIHFDELEYAEASGNNIKVVTQDGHLTPAMTFTHFEELLPKSKFIRVHRSFIINKSKIRLIEGNRVFIGTTEIPIGSNYKEHFFQQIGIK